MDLTEHFVGAATGNLHLRTPLPEIVGPGKTVDGVVANIGCQPLGRQPVLGADEVGEAGR